MATTYKITPETAKRTMGMIALHNGNLPAAIHDIRIVLRSLAEYTDRKSEAVLDCLLWIHTRDEKFPESIQSRREALAKIAEGYRAD